ncbi:MAG: zinc ribbon domain-containing protein [Firmicutes bacterium]|nr:zinc ribbon domain-containing protein [Bacillota bacterium]MDD4336882.1 zinc ribbon domain-containing protein [Bacillota bacterium]MDD4792602.1 zinc ribbon domain-containing protein [Bacillota bacterium]
MEYLNSKYTNQRCPNCGNLNKARDRNYKCGSGYEDHRNRVWGLIHHFPSCGRR